MRIVKLLNTVILIFLSIFISSCSNDDSNSDQSKIAFEARPEFLKGTNNMGILVIHGYSGSPQSVRPIAHKVNEWGYTANLMRLPGHATTPADMEKYNYKDWINAAVKEYQKLKSQVDKIYIFGFSMGGSLAQYIAENYPVDGVILLNSSCDYDGSMEKEVNSTDISTISGFYKGIGSDIKKPGVKEWAYDSIPKKSRFDNMNLKIVATKDLKKITSPLLILRSVDDHVTNGYNAPYIYDHVGSNKKNLVKLYNSYHVAALDYDYDIIMDEIKKFLEDNK